MADEIELDIKITVPTSVEPAGDMPDKWAAGLTNNAQLINDRRIAKIPDEGIYQSLVAEQSSTKWSPMIDAAFVSQSGNNQANIIRKQYKNLANSFNQWNLKLGLAFDTVDGVVAKRFKDQVNNSKDSWAEAVANKTLRATGDKIRGTILGQAVFWMTGDPNASKLVNHLELITGAPFAFMAVSRRNFWKAGIVGQMTQSLITILDADFLAAEVAAQNDILVVLCNAVKTAAVKPFIREEDIGAVDSTLSFSYDDPELVLHARIVLV